MIKALLFDYDGVIVDSFPIVHKVYQIMCAKLGKPCPKTMAKFKVQYGRSSREFMRKGQFTAAEIERADHIYLEEIQKQEVPFFVGINEVIQKLSKQYILFLISSSPQKDIELKLKKKKLGKCFTEIIGSRKLGPIKKVPELLELMHRHQLRAEEVVMIGDRINDYEDAQKAGIKKIILVEYGWGYDKEKIPKHRQKVIVHRPKDILQALKQSMLPIFMHDQVTRKILTEAIAAIPKRTKVYLVGGSVRNAFYYHFFRKKLPQRDYDLLLIGNKEKFIQNLRKKGFTYGRIRRKYEVVLKKKRIPKPKDWYQDHLFLDIHLSPEKDVLTNLKKYSTFTMNGFALPLPAVLSPHWRQQVLSLPTAIADLKKKQLRLNAPTPEPTTLFAAIRFFSVGFKAPSSQDIQNLLRALGKTEKRRFRRTVDKLFRYVGGERRARLLARKMGIKQDIFDVRVWRRPL